MSQGARVCAFVYIIKAKRARDKKGRGRGDETVVSYQQTRIGFKSRVYPLPIADRGWLIAVYNGIWGLPQGIEPMSEPLHSPLEGHAPHAGQFVEYHGALLPAWYSHSLEEHQAARSAAGLFDLSFRSKFTAKGPDRVRFLQGMVTNDVKVLTPGRGTYALLLDVRGHILADLRIYCVEDRFILDTDADLLEKVLQALNHYNIGGRTPLERLAACLLYTSPSPRDPKTSRMPSSA